MKPLRIEIHNLGAIAHTHINLSGVTIAAICGVNGAGKTTAFTIAPRFALFGATKPGTRVDDLVRTGATEMAVTFDFEHQGSVWRVIRTRSRKGKGKSTLDLQKRCGDIWQSESGASIDETQKKIIDLLGLDDETFVASSMILQGDAGNFTKRPAGQRKAILAQILQLEQYGVLQEKARAKAGEISLHITGLKSRMADIDARLSERTTIEAEKMATEIKLAKAAQDIAKQETDTQVLQAEYSALAARIEQADELERQSKVIQADIDATQNGDQAGLCRCYVGCNWFIRYLSDGRRRV